MQGYNPRAQTKSPRRRQQGQFQANMVVVAHAVNHKAAAPEVFGLERGRPIWDIGSNSQGAPGCDTATKRAGGRRRAKAQPTGRP
jgi:hypothetical protein